MHDEKLEAFGLNIQCTIKLRKYDTNGRFQCGFEELSGKWINFSFPERDLTFLVWCILSIQLSANKNHTLMFHKASKSPKIY